MQWGDAVNRTPDNGLRVGAGHKNQKGWINLDIRDVDGIDVVHDITHIPWPFEDDEFDVVMARDVLEHVPHSKTFISEDEAEYYYPDWFTSRPFGPSNDEYINVYDTDPLIPIMEEIGRICQDDGFLVLQFPKPNEFNDFNDPSHCRQLTPTLFQHWQPKSEHGSRWHGKSFDTNVAFEEVYSGEDQGHNYQVILRKAD